MKKTTALCILLSFLLTASVAGAAFAAETAGEPGLYIHPEAGYGFKTPAGWFTIDSKGIGAMTEDGVEAALAIVSQIADIEALMQSTQAVFLFPQDGTGAEHMSNININVSGTGTPLDMDTLVAAVEEQLEAQYIAMYPNYKSLRPAFSVMFRGHEVCIHGGTYTIGGTVMEMHQIYMLEGASLYTVTVNAPMDIFEQFQRVAADIIETFVMP